MNMQELLAELHRVMNDGSLMDAAAIVSDDVFDELIVLYAEKFPRLLMMSYFDENLPEETMEVRITIAKQQVKRYRQRKETKRE